MSYTAIYTPFYPLDVPPGEMAWSSPSDLAGGVRIHDPDGLDAFLDAVGIASSSTEVVTTARTDDADDYPPRQWEYLKGFRTWETDVHDSYNIERPPDRTSFFGGIGHFVEPFQFFTSPISSGFPHPLSVLTGGADIVAYHVAVHGGLVREVALEAGPATRQTDGRNAGTTTVDRPELPIVDDEETDTPG